MTFIWQIASKKICCNRGYGILSKTYLLYNIIVSSLNFLRHTAQEGSRKTICRIVMSLYLVIVSRKYCDQFPSISLFGLTTNYMVCVIVCTGRLSFISPLISQNFHSNTMEIPVYSKYYITLSQGNSTVIYVWNIHLGIKLLSRREY